MRWLSVFRLLPLKINETESDALFAAPRNGKPVRDLRVQFANCTQHNQHSDESQFAWNGQRKYGRLFGCAVDQSETVWEFRSSRAEALLWGNGEQSSARNGTVHSETAAVPRRTSAAHRLMFGSRMQMGRIRERSNVHWCQIPSSTVTQIAYK